MSIDLQERPELTAEAYDLAETPDYRVLSSSAVASCVLGIMSASVLLAYEYSVGLGIIPIIGVALGLRALWTIRSNPLEFTGQRLAIVGVVFSVLFLISGYSIAGYVYVTEVPEGYERISYSQLQVNQENPQELPPQTARELDGKQIFIKGYVYPGQQQEGIKQFVLCRDNGDCCFGGQPKQTDMILVTLEDPLRLNYSTRMVRLAGKFRVSKVGTSGVGENLGDALYSLQADHLE